MYAMPGARDIVENPSAARPVRPPVKGVGYRNQRTGTTFGGQKMSSGFSSGERPIRGTGAAKPGQQKMRYKIS